MSSRASGPVAVAPLPAKLSSEQPRLDDYADELATTIDGNPSGIAL